jgi:nucleotide-binding universal stress UspA family protein
MSVLPTRILLATDASEDAILAARAALDVSRSSGTELHLVHVWRPVPSSRFEAYIRREMAREARRLLDEQTGRVEAAGSVVSGAHLREGPKADEILDLAEELDAGLIVIGGRGQGTVQRLLLGSVAEGVAYHARCPVLVMRGGERVWPPETVIVGDDGSQDARAAASLAIGIGRLLGASALLLRAYPKQPEMDNEQRTLDIRPPDEQLEREKAALEARAEELEGESGLRPAVRTCFGNPAEAILEAARDVAEGRVLLAIGRRGLGESGRMRIGSVSTKVLRAARCPVLIYPHGRRS